MTYAINEMDSSLFLEHHGVKGMKWGVRRAAQAIGDYRSQKKALKKSYRNDGSPMRGLVNAGNSAARTYYRAQRTKNFSKYKKHSAKLELKVARLTDEQVKNGRYRVARARNIRRKAFSAVVGTAAGAATIAAGAAVVAPIIGLGAGTAANFASGGRYYAKQTRAYGGTRAKYEIKTANKREKMENRQARAAING